MGEQYAMHQPSILPVQRAESHAVAAACGTYQRGLLQSGFNRRKHPLLII